jgi:sterol desaturase/sphingolipid hydroxylase (fatty acid hydroxylase superfamily)
MQTLVHALPLLVVIALVEGVWLHRQHPDGYDWKESLASLGVAIGQPVFNLFSRGLALGIFSALWEYRWFMTPLDTLWGIALLFIGMEFAYYWEHRAAHTVRWFWASHRVHHSPNQMALANAYRLGWTANLSGLFLFFAPLVLLGLHPVGIASMFAVNLLYQFWLHTELVPRLGWVDKVLNTPSNHRVHHAANPEYLDCNFGGISVFFDHVFGTYRAETIACRYGLTTPEYSYNPLRIVFNEWLHIGHDLYHARNWRERLAYLFAAPGWQPDKT